MHILTGNHLMQDVIRFLPNGVRKETEHICGGPGGRLPHRAELRGGSPLPPEAPSQAFRAGISRMGWPLAAGGYPLPLGPFRSAWRPLRRVPHPGCGCAKAGADVQVSHAIQNNTL